MFAQLTTSLVFIIICKADICFKELTSIRIKDIKLNITLYLHNVLYEFSNDLFSSKHGNMIKKIPFYPEMSAILIPKLPEMSEILIPKLSENQFLISTNKIGRRKKVNNKIKYCAVQLQLNSLHVPIFNFKKIPITCENIYYVYKTFLFRLYKNIIFIFRTLLSDKM